MNTNDSSRRAFLQRLSALGLAGLGAGTVLAGCGGGESTPEAGEDPAMGGDNAVAGDFSCMDTTGLTESEISMRETLNYVDDSPNEDQVCANCQLYIAAEAGANCGGCTILKGPIHPQGYCTSWAPQVNAG